MAGAEHPLGASSRDVGLAEDVENLKSEMRTVEMVLAAADWKEDRQQATSPVLDDLKELLYDDEDVMDELDYYRLQQQIEQDQTASLLMQGKVVLILRGAMCLLPLHLLFN